MSQDKEEQTTVFDNSLKVGSSVCMRKVHVRICSVVSGK